MQGQSPRGSIYLSRRQFPPPHEPPTEQTPPGSAAHLVVEEQGRAEMPLLTAAGIDIEEIPRGSQTRREQGLAVIMAIERYKHAPTATWQTSRCHHFLSV